MVSNNFLANYMPGFPAIHWAAGLRAAPRGAQSLALSSVSWFLTPAVPFPSLRAHLTVQIGVHQLDVTVEEDTLGNATVKGSSDQNGFWNRENKSGHHQVTVLLSPPAPQRNPAVPSGTLQPHCLLLLRFYISSFISCGSPGKREHSPQFNELKPGTAETEQAGRARPQVRAHGTRAPRR